MAFFTDTAVNAMTQEAFLPTVFDQVIASTALSLRIMSNGKGWRGRQMVVPVKLTNSAQAQSFSGLDTFIAAELQTKQRMLFDLRGARQPVAISGLAISANDFPEEQVIDMVEEALAETQTELIDFFAGLMYLYGTGNGNKDFIGVGAAADDGTNVSTIGGLSKSTYTVLKGTYTSSGGTLSLSQMATLYSAISSGTDMSTPSLAPTTPAVFDLYEQLLTPTVRENYQTMGRYKLNATPSSTGGMSRDGLAGESGFVSISYRGVPLARDYKAPTGNLWMLNEKFIEWRGQKAPSTTQYKPVAFTPGKTITGVYGEAPLREMDGFNWSGFRAPMNQFGILADIVILGNILYTRPNRQGVLTAITGV
jgi:hypothetical protein